MWLYLGRSKINLAHKRKGNTMTREMKERIRRMKGNGASYPEMSEMLGLAEGTIKSFCRRNGLMGSKRGKPSKTAVGGNTDVHPVQMAGDASDAFDPAEADGAAEEEKLAGMGILAGISGASETENLLETDCPAKTDDTEDGEMAGENILQDESPSESNGLFEEHSLSEVQESSEPQALSDQEDISGSMEESVAEISDSAQPIISSEKAHPVTHFCPQCGAEVIQNPGRKEKKYCNNFCRLTWWNAHNERVRKKAIYHFECVYCKKPFTAYGNKHRKYCSHICYIKDRFGEDAGYGDVDVFDSRTEVEPSVVGNVLGDMAGNMAGDIESNLARTGTEG